MKQIKITCLHCNENMLVNIDDKFNVISIECEHDDELSDVEIKQVLNKNNIEFG